MAPSVGRHGEKLPLLGAHQSQLPVHPEVAASVLSKITFTWIGALLKQGARAPLELQDLWEIRESDDAAQMAANLRVAIDQSMQRDGVVSKIVLWRSIQKAFGFNMYIAGVCKLIGDLLGFVGPICINELIKYVEDPSSAWFYPRYYGYILSAALFGSTVLQTLCLHQHHHLVIREAIRVRSAITLIVNEKALTLSSQTKSALGSGRILNLATIDANRLLDLFYFIHYTWAAPLQIVLGMLLLVRFLGVAAFAGVGIMVLLIPCSAWLSAHAAQISKKLIETTDTRLKFMGEMLQHIRTVKFYAWELALLDQVESIRAEELGYLKRMVVWNSFSQLALQAGPILVSLGSFVVYAMLQSTPLTADAAFTAITLFGIFRLPLMMLPRIFSLLFNANVSVGRLAEFLAIHEHAEPAASAVSIADPASAFRITNATYGWTDGADADANTDSMTLSEISVTIPRGQLTMVVGPVGSGKSTLLAALLNELRPSSGSVDLPKDRVAYAAQTPYLVNASIEDNILFGAPRDATRLQRVIDCCELQSDLALLSDGILTELGENGINISGGQKQRVSIARAAYRQDQSLYVFDDALSALDASVASNIFTKCFSSNASSLLASQTRVLATHSLQFAKAAQWIIVMDKMRVVQMGTFEQLTKQQPDGTFARMYRSFGGSTSGTAVKSPTNEIAAPATAEATTVNTTEAAKLVEEEAKETGSVASAVYASYFRSCGVTVCWLAFAVLVLTQASQVATDLWLTKWTSAATSSTAQITYFISVYAYLSFATILLGFLGDLTCRLVGVRASRSIHARLLRRVVRGTMRFFDTTPIGRVLNRFSSDLNTIDQKLNAAIVSFATMLLSLASMLLIQSANVPLLLVLLAPVFWVYHSVQLYYRQSCRELQRLDSVTKSPVFSHLTATLTGLVTIRAFRLVAATLHAQAQRINQNTKASLSLNLTNRWLGVRLESLGALITLAVACFICQQHLVISSAMAGLMLSYAQGISGLLNWIVRNNIDMENALNSVERTDEYTRVDIEPIDLKDGSSVDILPAATVVRPQWPERGEIVFASVQVKYHEGADPVLHSLSFTVKGGEHVGICGRTGAGKSSLLLTLFRMIQPNIGSITIDGVDIAGVDLTVLRSRMAIIPQEPVLFATSIRFNLDPTGAHDDATLWAAVKKAHLHDFVRRLPGQLDAEVLEAGANLSVGERQLICLARAILKASTILCLDEATASMDHSTDALIQQSIRDEFKQATVLTIAHRVQTIADYDKILVLQRGRIAEYGPPKELLKRKGGEFAAMMASGH